VFLGNGKGVFSPLTSKESGIALRGEVRGVKLTAKHLFVLLKSDGIHKYRNLSSKE
jgi:hypothetical protein